MYRLAIEDHDGHRTVVPVAREEVSIGRRVGSTIRLTDRNVSRTHARLQMDDDGLWLVDESRYGTWLNERKIAGKAELRQGDSLRVGDYRLTLLDELADTVLLRQESGVTSEYAATLDRVPDLERDTLITSAPGDGPDPAPETASHLVIVSQPQPGRQIPLDEGSITIGRTDENDVVVDDESLSRMHARFDQLDGRWEVSDLDTVNGVRVNGLGVEESVLRDGDLIELGAVVFRFVDAGSGWRFRTVEIFSEPVRASRAGWPLMAGIGLLLGVVIALLWSTVPNEVIPPVPVATAPARTAPPPRPIPAPAPPPDRSAELDDMLQRGQAAMGRRDWAAAVAVLGRGADRGLTSAEAESMFAIARGEQANQARLRDAQNKLNAGKLDEAELALKAVAEASAYLPEAEALGRRLEAARSAARVTLATATQPAPAAAPARVRKASSPAPRTVRAKKRPAVAVPPPKPFGPTAAERRQIAERHFHEGRRLHTLGRTAGAEIELRKAAQMAPGFAEPHLILGLIYTRAGRKPEAIRSLRRFLKLAPGDKRRTMVEKMLRQMQ